MTNIIYPFYRGYLSQWYDSIFTVENLTFNCAEQFMMYSKALLFGDYVVAEKILISKTPSEQKKLGRIVQGFNEEKWKFFRTGIVFTGNFHKFSQNKYLLDFLLETGDTILVEASPKDKIWGVGLAIDDERIQDPLQWRGLNLLGIALAQVRETLRWNMRISN